MEKTQMGMWRKFVAVLVSVTLVLGLNPTAAFATTGEGEEVSGGSELDVNGDGKVTYVSLGESMTNGYGTNGYYPLYDGTEYVTPKVMERLNRDIDEGSNTFGLGRTEVDTYPSQFATYLEETYGMTVDWQPWAISGQRPEDFYWLMQDGWNTSLSAGADENQVLFSDDGIYNGDMYTTEVWKNGNGGEGAISRFLSARYGRWTTSKIGTWGDEIKGDQLYDDAGNKLKDAYGNKLFSNTTWTYSYDSTGFLRTYYSVNADSTAQKKLEQFRSEYQEAIAGADVISVNLGTHSFSSVVSSRLIGLFGGTDCFDDGRANAEALLAYYPEYQEVYEQIVALLHEQLDSSMGALGSKFDELFSVYAYATLSFLITYDESLDIIRELNPDAQIVVLGMTNFMDGLAFDLGDGVVLDMGALFGALVDFTNAYRATCADSLDSIFVPAVEDMDLLIDEFVRGEANRTFLTKIVNSLSDENASPKAVEYLDTGILPEGCTQDTLVVAGESEYGTFGQLMTKYQKLMAFAKDGGFSDAVSVAALANGYDEEAALEKFVSGESLNEADEFALCMYLRSSMAEGIGCHPSNEGHAQVAAQMIECWEAGYTGKDYVADEITDALTDLYQLITEHYDEALAYGYQYAKDNGYVDQAIEALDQLEDQLYDMAAWVEANGDQMGAELKAALVDEIDAAIASIEELKALLGATDAPAQQAAVAAALSLEEGVQTYSSEQGVAALSCDIESHLANIASLIESASADLGEAALAELKAMGDQACAKLQAMIPVVEQCLAEKLQAAAEYLKDKLGDAYTSFVEAARDAAAEYAPQAAQALYDYLLNNPEQVISFFAEYGPYVVDFFGEHASAIAEIVEYVSANYGEQALEYVFDNAGQILKAMVWVVENYGDEAWELIKVYMSASGADQAVSDLYEQLLGYGDELYNAALMQLKSSLAQLDVQIAASFAGLMDNLEALGAETAEAVLAEAAKAQLKIDAVVAEISDMIACGNVAVGELEAKVAELEAILDELEASLDGADEEVAAAVASEIEKARAYVAELKAAISADLANSMYEATHGEYVITEGSQYVALGDATITGDGSYADQLAAQIEAKASENGVSLGESWFTKLASEGLLAEDFAAFVEENSEAIAAADLISVSMGQENLTTFVNKSLLAFESNGSVDFDWSVYVGSDGVAYVEQVLDMIKAELAEEMGAAYADMAASVIEAYAYGYVGFATNYFKVLDQIQSINPDAQVVVVGLNNAFGADTTLDLSLVGVEDEIEIGKYASYVVASTDLQYLAYAMIAGDDDVTFVSAPAAQTSVSGMGKLGIMNIMSKLTDTAAWMPSAEGQGCVLGQINDAMTFSVEGSSESASIEDAVVAPIADQVYTSKNIEPAVTVELDGAQLTEGTDFTVVYFDNVEVGTATALVEGEGSYEGTVEATFEIVHLATAASFTDFVEGEWYLVETDGRGSFTGQRTLFMDYVLANGLMSGYKTNGVLNGLFGPHDNLTRAQAATILYRIANPDSTATDDPAAYAQENTTGLSDVEAGRYYTAAVNWCQENGVITGYKNTDTGEYYAFGSEDNVTREQLATMIYRFCVEYNGVEGAAADLSSFDDAGKISGYAQEAMAFCYANGVMTGRYGMNSIDPLGKSERCEVSKMIAVSTRDLLGL